jgi:hypothetical protein
MPGLRSLLLSAAAVGAVAAVVVFWRHGPQGDAGLQHWLAIHTGTDNEPGGYYGFWSGFGSDIAEVSLLGAVLGIWHKHNCHTKGCWRIGKHVVEGTPWCNRHHGDARAQSLPAESPLERKFDVLIESVDGLAEAIRSSLQARRGRSS